MGMVREGNIDTTRRPCICECESDPMIEMSDWRLCMIGRTALSYRTKIPTRRTQNYFPLFYDHQPSSPSVGAAETTLGVGDGALKLL